MSARPTASAAVAELLRGLDGVELVLDEEGKRVAGLDHPRSGELVAISKADRWFSYYFWLDDERAPDYARTVDIHRKPGYDPVELFVDPAIRFPPARRRLAAREAQARPAHAARRHLAEGHAAGERLARPADRRPERGPARHQLAARPPAGRKRRGDGRSRTCVLRHVFRRRKASEIREDRLYGGPAFLL